MASSFSSGKGFELITTGEQAGTWGETTNQNLRKIEQSQTQWSWIKVGTGATDTISPSTWEPSQAHDSVTGCLTLKIDDSASANASGTELRAAFIDISNGGTNPPTEDFNVFITSETVARIP